jgi:hypothetical protein
LERVFLDRHVGMEVREDLPGRLDRNRLKHAGWTVSRTGSLRRISGERAPSVELSGMTTRKVGELLRALATLTLHPQRRLHIRSIMG